MDQVTFTNAVVALIEAKSDVRLRQFLRTLRRYVNAESTLSDCEMALDEWAIFCASIAFSVRSSRSKIVA